MATTAALAQERVWFHKPTYDRAACLHFEKLAKLSQVTNNCAALTDKIPEHQELEASVKNSITNSSPPSREEPIACINEQLNSSKKSKDKNNKASKKHRNLKKSKSEAVDTKEQITPIQQCWTQESQQTVCPIVSTGGSLVNEIAKARQHLKKSLQCMNGIAACPDVTLQDLVSRCATLEKDNQELRNSVAELKEIVKQLEFKVNISCTGYPIAICPAKPQDETSFDAAVKGSDPEGDDTETVKSRSKKSKKSVPSGKSNVHLDARAQDNEILENSREHSAKH